ncbi:MAG TPA: aminotransferase class III-fold pyridoxal phosphate-dependent enzyme, partial [Gemmatimonadales bacterium]|nr:aminotransferase class III-fold pyridoxal phosphate-dependent enzyme [Gemmatimonadales bacterium]
PIACAAALAQIREIEEHDLVGRAARLGEVLRERAQLWARSLPAVAGVRGRGLFTALVLRAAEGRTAREIALASADEAARRGVLVLAEGSDLDVLALTPPAVITDAQLERALDVLAAVLATIRP